MIFKCSGIILWDVYDVFQLILYTLWLHLSWNFSQHSWEKFKLKTKLQQQQVFIFIFTRLESELLLWSIIHLGHVWSSQKSFTILEKCLLSFLLLLELNHLFSATEQSRVAFQTKGAQIFLFDLIHFSTLIPFWGLCQLSLARSGVHGWGIISSQKPEYPEKTQIPRRKSPVPVGIRSFIFWGSRAPFKISQFSCIKFCVWTNYLNHENVFPLL